MVASRREVVLRWWRALRRRQDVDTSARRSSVLSSLRSTSSGERVKMVAHPDARKRSLDETDDLQMFESVDWSCCCCSRRLGILILGGVFFCLSVAVLVLCVVGAAELEPPPPPPPPLILTALAGLPSFKPRTQPHRSVAAYLQNVTAAEEAVRLKAGVRGLLIAQATVAGVGIATALILLAGAFFERAWALLPWMVSASLQVALLVAGALYCVATSMSKKLPLVCMDGFFALVVMFLCCVPVLYCILAVYTYHRELRCYKYDMFESPRRPMDPPTTVRPGASPAAAPAAAPGAAPRIGALAEGKDNPVFESTAF